MERDKVKELDEYSNELGVSQLLLRVIIAYAIVYTKNYDMYTPKEMVYNLAKESLDRVDIEYVKSIGKNENRMRVYGREIVQEVANDMGIVNTKKNNLL